MIEAHALSRGAMGVKVLLAGSAVLSTRASRESLGRDISTLAAPFAHNVAGKRPRFLS
jgi:hypothetical protein